MNTLLIHIGLPKTGTKSLQEIFNIGYKDLEEYNICYPMDSVTKHNTSRAHDGFLFNFKNVIPILKNHLNTNDVILSSESISGWASYDSSDIISKKIQILKKLNSKIAFIISVRNFDEWVCSYLKQNIRIDGIQNTNEEFWANSINQYIKNVNKLLEVLKINNMPIYLIQSDPNMPEILIQNFQNILTSLTQKDINNILVKYSNKIGKVNATIDQNFFQNVFSSYLRKLYVQKHKSYKFSRDTLLFVKKFEKIFEFKNDEDLMNLFNEYLDSFIFQINNLLITKYPENILNFKKNFNLICP
jgi:hypothetical protein